MHFRRPALLIAVSVLAISLLVPSSAPAQNFASAAFAGLAEAVLFNSAGKTAKLLPWARTVEDPDFSNNARVGVVAGIVVVSPNLEPLNKPAIKKLNVTVTWPGVLGSGALASKTFKGKWNKESSSAIVCGTLPPGATGQDIDFRFTGGGGKNAPGGSVGGFGASLIDLNEADLTDQDFQDSCDLVVAPAFRRALRAQALLATFSSR